MNYIMSEEMKRHLAETQEEPMMFEMSPAMKQKLQERRAQEVAQAQQAADEAPTRQEDAEATTKVQEQAEQLAESGSLPDSVPPTDSQPTIMVSRKKGWISRFLNRGE